MKTETLLLGGAGLALGALALDRFNKADAAKRQALILGGGPLAPGQQITVATAQAEGEGLMRESIGYGLAGAALLGLAFYMR
jgi:hypothetical protein